MSRSNLVVTAVTCILVLTCTFAGPVLAQDEIDFTASVDRMSIAIDDVLTLELTVTGPFRVTGQPQLPSLEGFLVVGTSQSSQFSMVNRKISSKVVFTYHLRPTSAGALSIPAASIELDGRTYWTQSIAIEVTEAAAPDRRPTPFVLPDSQAPSDLSGRDIFVDADVDLSSPFVGQQIVYRFRLYQAIRLFNQPSLDWPSFTGFLTYDLSPNSQYDHQVGERLYRVTEVRRALFPTRTGEAVIDPATLSIPGDLFNRGVRVQTQAITVSVRPLPPGAPGDYAGAVGRFEIDAWVEPSEGRVNEPVTLVVRVTGSGNVSLIGDPAEGLEADLNGWRVYDPQISTDVAQETDVIRGEKRFERPMVPKTEGDLTIPSFALTYFDPEAGEYRRTETSELVVRVSPGDADIAGPVSPADGKRDVIVMGGDIRHIKPAPPAMATREPLLLVQPVYWLGWGLPLAAVAATRMWEQRRRRLAHDVAAARSLRARRTASRRLSQARRLAKTDEDGAYAAVARALSGYLGDKFNLASAGLTGDAIRRTLASRHIPEDVADRLLACLEWADSGRFAPVAAGRHAEDLAREGERLVAELEDRIST